MNKIIDNLNSHKSEAPSKWREEAEFLSENKAWLRYSQRVAMLMLDKMDDLNITQKSLAEKMGCSQQYVSKILKGRENLSIETLSKIENALHINLLPQMSEIF